jgi:hypothetical protein
MGPASSRCLELHVQRFSTKMASGEWDVVRPYGIADTRSTNCANVVMSNSQMPCDSSEFAVISRQGTRGHNGYVDYRTERVSALAQLFRRGHCRELPISLTEGTEMTAISRPKLRSPAKLLPGVDARLRSVQRHRNRRRKVQHSSDL